MSQLMIPKDYSPIISPLETQRAIKKIKDYFQQELAYGLNLRRVSAPLFVFPETGLNDNLSGVERRVHFSLLDLDEREVEVVQSLAKWKRMALGKYGIKPGHGIYTDMNAIRRDEELDNLHSVYVDQWDWEKVITREQRTQDTLNRTVCAIMEVLKKTELVLAEQFPKLKPYLPDTIHFVSSQELEDKYPSLTPKQREDAAAKEYGAVFISQIGGALKSGIPHDGRAPDYDDWSLNGDILIWYPVLNRSFEVSSMGIRVDAETLKSQLETAGCAKRASLPFHSMLLKNELPLTMGGGIGQSRICMAMLQKAHIGEVQASVWRDSTYDICDRSGIHLL